MKGGRKNAELSMLAFSLLEQVFSRGASKDFTLMTF
jgi:hypothetical protein